MNRAFIKTACAIAVAGVLTPVLVFAQSLSLPHQFFGSVDFTNGAAVDGLTVEAKINGSVVGSSVTAGGNYGYNPSLLFALDNDGVHAGKTVEFYVGGIKANETGIFANGNSTNLNLIVPGSVGVIEETDEDSVIEDQTAVITPSQISTVKLGSDLNIAITSEENTTARIREVKKLTSSFFTGATAVISGNNLLNAYEIDITGDDISISVTVSYDDSGIDEDTVKPYKFNETAWIELSYTINKTANTITFIVSSAETPYSVFGSSAPAPTPPPSPPTGSSGGSAPLPPPSQPEPEVQPAEEEDEPAADEEAAPPEPSVSPEDGQVLGERIYADGTLIRANNKRIYVIINQQRRHVASLEELRRLYAGKPIIDVADSAAAAYPVEGATTAPSALNAQGYANGTLIRAKDKKIYVVENRALRHIASLGELRAFYAGRPIIDISGAVAGARSYGAGELIRGSDKKIYVVTPEGGKRRILSLAELARDHFRKPIHNVADSVLAQY